MTCTVSCFPPLSVRVTTVSPGFPVLITIILSFSTTAVAIDSSADLIEYSPLPSTIFTVITRPFWKSSTSWLLNSISKYPNTLKSKLADSPAPSEIVNVVKPYFNAFTTTLPSSTIASATVGWATSITYLPFPEVISTSPVSPSYNCNSEPASTNSLITSSSSQAVSASTRTQHTI